MLEHGGDMHAMAQQFAISESAWLDLSTGINPSAWPVPTVPDVVWQRLPQHDDLHEIAARYYQAEQVLAVAGSQAAIQVLPGLRGRCKVGVLSPCYAEHAYRWRQAGHQVIELSLDRIPASLPLLDVLIVVNPNNPTGYTIPAATLREWYQQLAARQGWLIVDEAYMDLTPQYSLASEAHQAGLIVLRSLGKFFGLAGIRVGFVLADKVLLTRLQQQLGPWTVSGPARYIARQALQDVAWQQASRANLALAANRLAGILCQSGFPVDSGIALFKWFRHPRAKDFHDLLAANAIAIRYFAADKFGMTSVRIGLPGKDSDWQRLGEALVTYNKVSTDNEAESVCMPG